MSDTEGEDVSASSDMFYEYDTNSKNWITLQKYFQKYKHGFPLLCMVTEGDCGPTLYDDLCNDTVLRIHGYTSQRRVIAKHTEFFSKKLSYCSIPVQENYTFCVVKSHKETKKAQKLCDIVTENEYPVQVVFPKDQTQFRVDDRDEKSSEIGALLLLDEYIENFLICNVIHERSGQMLLGMILMACTDNMNCTPITGIRGKSNTAFVEHLKGLERIIAINDIKFNNCSGNPSATTFTETHTGSGNPLPKIDTPLYPVVDQPLFPVADPPKRPFKPLHMRPALPIPGNSTNTDSISSTKCTVEASPKNPTKFSQDIGKLPYVSQSKRYERLNDYTSPQEYKKLITNTNSCHIDPSSNHVKTDFLRDRRSIKRSDLVASGEYEVLPDNNEYVYIREAGRSQISEITDKDDKKHRPKHRAMLKSLTIKEVGEKLYLLGLQKYVKTFSKARVDGVCLVEYDREILQEDFKFMIHEAIRLEKFITSGHIPQ